MPTLVLSKEQNGFSSKVKQRYFPTVPGLILVIIGPDLGWSEADVRNARIIVWGSGILGSGLAGLVGKGDPGNRSEWGGASSDNYGSSSNSWEAA